MNRNEEAGNDSRIPEANPSKPMDSKKEVENSPDPKTDQDFPGYPHYPAKEDIMDQRTGSHRVDADLEDMGTGSNASGVNQRFLAGQERHLQTDAADDTAEGESADLSALNSREEEVGTPQNTTNEDLSEGELRTGNNDTGR